LDNKTWNVSDIAGSSVIDENGVLVGILEDVLPTGSNDVWVIKTALNASGELLLPALKSVVTKIDVQARKIYIVMPPGLREVFEEHAEAKKTAPQPKKPLDEN
jgi:16S rRNA processing protein RimM